MTRAMGLAIPWPYCLLFGVLISPTDPIAVLAVLQRVGVPKSLKRASRVRASSTTAPQSPSS
ncbi:cation:proton antiporter [Variovorax sp. LG9.2]|uniref:cation:proton antiporter domain-containing protein n=1 Tax=Variovorax sp. LG9.2 TaxID=3048626 RepID=UPI003A59988D